LNKRPARTRRQKPAPVRPDQITVSQLVHALATRLKKAKLVFAHGTADPVAEAAFLVGETLGIHPDHVEARAASASIFLRCAAHPHAQACGLSR
jgi:hypothetical protein